MFERESLRLVSNRIQGAKVHKMGMFPTDWWMGKHGAAPAEAKAP